MNEGLIPKRYAKALLKFAQERGVEEKLYGLTSNLCRSFAEHEQLDATLANPFVDAEKKIQLLTTAAGATEADTVYADFLKLLRQNNRLDMARAIALAYGEEYRRSHSIYRVEVTSAAPMGVAEEARLKKLIESHLKGGTMEYTTRVNPDLIGGFTVKINSENLDASVRNQLKQLQLKLLS